ncbi:MAG: hypothetical protein QM497_01715 [Sulfurimonas sp.]
MKNILLSLSLIITLSTTLLADKTPTKTQDLTTKQMKAQNIIITKMFVQEISKGLPHTIDKYTKLISVTNQESTIIYNFEINTGSKSDEAVIAEDKTRMKTAITNGVCKSSMKFLESDINISYIYNSAASKKKLFQFNITQEDCTM